jgi:hypothetical protein
MSKVIYDMAKRYYPDKWSKAHLDHLLEIGRLTQEEYDDIIGGNNEESNPD